MATQAKIGIIGGSGLYQMEALTSLHEVRVNTPFGEPSDAILVGLLDGLPVAFLPRHGRGHRVSPSDMPNRANIYALKSLGVERIISVSAVGSLKEELRPLDMVVPDQLIDRTNGRASTFFQGGVAVHVAFADPFCPTLSQLLFQASQEVMEGRAHEGGTYIVIEGPAFSTKAESALYRSWGASIIGMTALPEAKLAREAEVCYSILASVTDYDCWHPEHAFVSVDMVIENLKQNIESAQAVLRRVLPRITQDRRCQCASALKNAIVTAPAHIGQTAQHDLGILIQKYLN
ncbi:MAG: S-methyl-5'-thioadenosine phosphorylase [Chloroflexi bacterium]|nr:S-methyl-5'-thioadenosine phosphorylase [Chloroflexota bacterium]